MNRNMYRICIVMIIVVAVVSGVFYYQYYQKQKNNPKMGTFVRMEISGSECV